MTRRNSAARRIRPRCARCRRPLDHDSRDIYCQQCAAKPGLEIRHRATDLVTATTTETTSDQHA